MIVGADWTLHPWRHINVGGGVTAGQARHNSGNVGDVNAGQVRHNSSSDNYERLQQMITVSEDGAYTMMAIIIIVPYTNN